MEQALSLARLHRRSDLRMAPLLRRAGEIAAFAGQVRPAEALLRESLAMTERLHGPHGVATVSVRLSLARSLAWSARTAEARLLADRALADATAPIGGHEPFQLQETRRLVFEVYWEQGDLAACRRLLAQAFADFGPAAPDSFEHADLLIDRAMVETEDGHLARARETLAQTVSMAQRLGFGPRSLMNRILAFQTAEQQLAAGDGHGALATLNQLEAGAEKEKVAGDAPLALRARALAASGQTEQARGLIDAELRELQSDPNRDARAAVEAHLLLISGQLALQANDCRSALPALQRSAELYASVHVPESPQRLKVEKARSTCLAQLAATGATAARRSAGAPR
jgi:hypothetical protein